MKKSIKKTEPKIIERFWYLGDEFIKYSDGTVNTYTNQRYRDKKRAKQRRIALGWDKPVTWDD